MNVEYRCCACCWNDVHEGGLDQHAEPCANGCNDRGPAELSKNV